MKKLLSTLLALVMLFSLTAPALAAAPENDLDPPLWKIWGWDSYEEFVDSWSEEVYAEDLARIQEYMSAHPEQTAQFRAGAYEYYEDELYYSSYYDSPEEYMQEFGYTEEQFVTVMTVLQVLDALDAEEYARQWAELCAQQPEKTAQFLAELEDWFAEEYSYYDSLEEYCSMFSCPEEAYIELFDAWSYDPVQAWADNCAQYPAETAQFLAGLETWFQESYPWYDSLDEYIEYHGGREEAYNTLFAFWYLQQTLQNQTITGMGGVPGQINVLLNDKCVSFPDAVPEIENGRTMVPVRAIAEALGAEMDYQGNDDIRCIANGFQYTFSVGESTVSVLPTAENTADVPQPEDIVMDCAPYIKGGRTYVPVRFFAQALGYEVGWDSEYRTVVLIDREALAEEIDKDFTVLNGILAREIEDQAGKTRRAAGSANATLTLFDSLNGDTVKEMSWSADVTTDDTGMDGQYEYDFSSLWELLEEYSSVPLDEEELDQELALIQSLLSGAVQLRVNSETGTYYIQWPALNAIYRESGLEIADGDWVSLSLTDGESVPAAQEAPELTMGQLLSLTALAAGGTDSIWTYPTAVESAATAAKFTGDERFTRSGDGWTFSLDREDLVALFEDDAYELDSLTQFSFTANFRDNGDQEMDIKCTGALDDGGMNLGNVLQITVSSSLKDGKGKAAVEFHIKNTLKLTIDVDQTVTTVDTAPELTPPAGSVIHDLEELTTISAPAVPDGPTALAA